MNTQQTYLQHHCDFIFPLKKQKEVSISSMNEPYTQTIELHWNFWPYICTMPSTLLTWMGSWQIRDSPMGCPSCFNLALVVPLIITHFCNWYWLWLVSLEKHVDLFNLVAVIRQNFPKMNTLFAFIFRWGGWLQTSFFLGKFSFNFGICVFMMMYAVARIIKTVGSIDFSVVILII